MAKLTASWSIILSAQNPSIQSPTVNLGALTSRLEVRIRRPTTAVPVNWPNTAKIRVSLVILVDGVQYTCTGTVSGGVRVTPVGEASEYVLIYSPPVFFGEKALTYLQTATVDRDGNYTDVPLTRIGETGTTVQGYLRIERISGRTETTVTIATTTEEPAPRLAKYHNSVAFNAATDGQELNGDGVLSVSHTAAGSDRAAFAGVGGSSEAGSVTSITYAGSGMTQLWDFTDAGPSLLNGGFVLAGVSTGAQTVTSTLNSAVSDHALGVISFTGVDQTTPTGNTQTSTGSGTTASVTVTGVTADDMVVDNIVTDYGGGGAPSVGAGQTRRYTETMAWVGSHVAGSTQGGASGGVMSWTFDSRVYTLGAARLIAAAAGAGANPKGPLSNPFAGPFGGPI